MTTLTAFKSRLRIARWSQLERWDAKAAQASLWQGTTHPLRPLAEALTRYRAEAPRTDGALAEWQLVTVRFDGSMEPRNVKGKLTFKGKLFAALPGHVIYSKIDARNGAIGIIPERLPRVAVSSEFPVYAIRAEVASPEYIKLLFRSAQFQRLIQRLVSGASGRKRVEPAALERLSVPLPPLPVQAAIVEAYETGVAEAARLRQEAARLEAERRELFRETLGLTELPPMSASKVLILSFSKLDLWGLQSARSLQRIAGLQQTNYPFLTGEDFLLSVKNGCSDAPSFKPTELEVLKISAVTKGILDLGQRKYIADEPAYRRNFDLQAGDVLMCRTNGTLGMVGMSALIEEDLPDTIYPDKVIRLRVNPEVILPAFLWRALQLPYVRAQIEAAARTAVGNYAIGGADIWALKVPLPPLEIQQQLISEDEQLRTAAHKARLAATETEAATVAQVEGMILGQKV